LEIAFSNAGSGLARTANSGQELAIHMALPVLLGPIAAKLCTARTNGFPKALEPGPRPGEFKPQDRETDWNKDHCRAGNDNHDKTQQEHGAANQGHGKSSSQFVSYPDRTHIDKSV